MSLYFKEFESPVGRLKLVADEDALVAILWEDDSEDRVRLPAMKRSADHKVLCKAEKQLEEYFAGRRTTFELPLKPLGTEFQKKVWSALKNIPFGETRNYGQLAREIGSAKASRAVGAANGKNPLSIVVPCHRVIGANGKLTGFAGGLKAKKILLDLESRLNG